MTVNIMLQSWVEKKQWNKTFFCWVLIWYCYFIDRLQRRHIIDACYPKIWEKKSVRLALKITNWSPHHISSITVIFQNTITSDWGSTDCAWRGTWNENALIFSWVLLLRYTRNHIQVFTPCQMTLTYQYSFKDYMKPNECKKSLKITLSCFRESFLNLNLTLNEKGSVVRIRMIYSLCELGESRCMSSKQKHKRIYRTFSQPNDKLKGK